MARTHFTFKGNRPLADTALGAAGEVSGTERSRLQQLWEAAYNSLGDVLRHLYVDAITLQPPTDSDTTVSLRGLNAAGTIQRWSIQQDGLMVGLRSGVTVAVQVPDNAETALAHGLGARPRFVHGYYGTVPDPQNVITIGLAFSTGTVSIERADATYVYVRASSLGYSPYVRFHASL